MAVNATKTEGAAAALGLDASEVDVPEAHAQDVTWEVPSAPPTDTAVARSESGAAVAVAPLEAASGTAPSAAATAYALCGLSRLPRTHVFGGICWFYPHMPMV